MKRVVLLMASFAILAASGFAHADNKPLTKVKVGHLVAIDLAPLFVAKESGCFAKQGLDVETVFFSNPGDNNAALAGGAIDISVNPFTLAFFAADSGVPIRVISAAGGAGVIEIVGQGNLGLKTMADIKSVVQSNRRKLRIATLQGDTLELILKRELSRNSISEKDVDIIYFNDLLGMVEAFRSGQVDLLTHIKPYTTDLLVNKGAVVLASSAKTYSPTTPNSVVGVLDKTLRERQQVMKAYLSGLMCAAQIINTQPEKAATLLTNGNYFRVSPKVLLEALKTAPAPVTFLPDVQAIQSVVDELKRLGYAKGTATTNDVFRLDLLKALEK